MSANTPGVDAPFDLVAPPVTRDAHGLGASTWALAALCLLVATLTLVPLALLAWQSVHTVPRLAETTSFTFAHFQDAFARLAGTRLLLDSLGFAGGTAAFALITGTVLAWLGERTDAPFRQTMFVLALVPLVIPGVLFTVAWMLLGSPRIGLVNVTLRALFGGEGALVDVYSLGGMIFVSGLHYSPLAFLLVTAALRASGGTLEEAAVMSGAGPWRVASRITLPLAWPALLAALLLVFVRAIESFEVPALLGLPAGIEVFTSAIYRGAQRYPAGIGTASAFAMMLVIIAGAALLLHSRVARREGRYATIAGKGVSSVRHALGRGRYVAGAVIFVYALCIAVLPLAALLWSSLQPFHRGISADALGSLTFEAYRRLFSLPALPRAALNSALLAILAASVVMLVGAVTSWVVVRTRVAGRHLLDMLASLPIAMPGIALGLALMITHLVVPSGIYGTLWILLTAYAIRFLPYGVRYASIATLKVDRTLEEAARMSGAGWSIAFRRIVLPLIRPGLLAGWIYVLLLSIRELSSSILLYSPGTEVVAVVVWELWENGQYPELAALGVLFVATLAVIALAARAFIRGFAPASGVGAPPC